MRLIQKIVIGIIGVCCLASCDLIHSDEADCQPHTSNGDPFAYVSLRITTGDAKAVTKANPTGGETGDGSEAGQPKENQIDHVFVFFFEATDDGINGDESRAIVARQYWTKDELTADGSDGYASEVKEIEGLQVQHTYDVLAVANVNSSLFSNVRTLGELRDLTVTSLYSSDYDNFVMASANAGDKLVVHLNNSKTNPAMTDVIDIERAVARVDYRAKGSAGRTDGIYEVTDKLGQTAEAQILSAMLINTLNSEAPSYLFKRVTKTGESFASGSLVYLGDETSTDQGVATNYVIDPLRTSKAPTHYDKDTYFIYFEYNAYDDLSWGNYFVDKSLITGLDDDYICVGYPKENINAEGNRNCTTGIVFKARYTPTGYSKGQTFFSWEGKIYPTIEAMMEAYDPSGWKIIDEAQDQWADITTWELLRTNIIFKLRGGDPAGYRAWLVEQSEGKESDVAITAEEKAALRWTKYCETQLYYRLTSDGKVEVDINGVDGSTREALTRKALYEASGAETFKEGICYYTYWIKHANDNDATNDLTMGKTSGGGLMEYAIVRNNIYKLNVNSISSLGNDVPGDCMINVNVLVENWQPLHREDIAINPTN